MGSPTSISRATWASLRFSAASTVFQRVCAVEHPVGGAFGGEDFGVFDAALVGVVVGDAGGFFVELGTGAVGGGGDGRLALAAMDHLGVEVINGHYLSGWADRAPALAQHAEPKP